MIETLNNIIITIFFNNVKTYVNRRRKKKKKKPKYTLYFKRNLINMQWITNH